MSIRSRARNPKRPTTSSKDWKKGWMIKIWKLNPGEDQFKANKEPSRRDKWRAGVEERKYYTKMNTANPLEAWKPYVPPLGFSCAEFKKQKTTKQRASKQPEEWI